MYNKLFTKILDSSIWMEPLPTRIVWLTFIAAMDENGYVQFAGPANVAHRAIVPLDDTIAAIAALEAPDPNSSDPDNDGRRIERVPGGWLVLNAKKYREMVTRVVIQEQTAKRVREHRARRRNALVTLSNENVTERNENVTPSVSLAGSISEGGGGADAPNTPTPPGSESAEARKAKNREALRRELIALCLPASPDSIEEWAIALQGSGQARTIDEVTQGLAWVVKMARRANVDPCWPRNCGEFIRLWGDRLARSRAEAAKESADGKGAG